MPTCRSILACLALATLCALLGFATYGVWIITGVAEQLPERMEAAVLETRGALLGEVADTRVEVLKHFDRLERRADSRLGKIEADATNELAATRELVATRLDASLARVDTALGEIHGLHGELTPSLLLLSNIAKNTEQITAHTNEATTILFARNALPAQLLGVLGATKVTMGQTAETMRDIQRAMPATLLTWQRIGANVDQTSANIARISKPHWYDNLLKGAGVGLGGAAIVLRH